MAMTHLATRRHAILWAGIVCAAAVAGCAQFQAPRIDPTGERVFAEPVVNTAPSFQVVPAPVQESTRMELVICPHETVAPVGSEVVVLAGVRGADNYLLTNSRVEWLLEPGGTGQFVEVGRGTAMDWLVGDFTWPRKIDNSFAVGSTSRRYLRLSRGTVSPDDDVLVLAGQAWISVTSPAGGISRVTAYAGEVDDWQRRKRTAVIHWVDAQWCLPPPSINPAGTSRVLTTTVSRQTDGSPCVGWRVRYEIVDGPAAGFSPSGAQQAEVTVDETGQASAEIFQQEPAPGTSTVQIRVIRPAELEGLRGKRLVVGCGATLQTWSAADVTVRKSGPQRAGVGAKLTYRIDVSNPGDLAAENVTLVDLIPDGLSYLGSEPEGERVGNSVEWRFGTLEAGETQSVEVDFRAERQGTVTNTAEATAEGLRATGRATTEVATPSIDVQMAGPEQPVTVGDEMVFKIVVANRSDVSTPDLIIKDRFDLGLEHAEIPSPIERDLKSLSPGESREIGVALTAVMPGEWSNTVELIHQGQIVASATARVTAVEPSTEKPKPAPAFPGMREESSLSVKLVTPPSCMVGQSVQFLVEVTNTGQQELTNLRFVQESDAAFVPDEPPDSRVDPTAPITWVHRSLMPGVTERYGPQFRGVRAAAAASTRVTVTSDQGAKGEDQAFVEILQASAMAPAELEMTIEDRHDAIDAGTVKTFVIRVVNEGQSADHQVELTVTLPREMEPVRFGTVPTTFQIVGQTMYFDAVDTIEAGETLEFRVRVGTMQPSEDARITAELNSESLRRLGQPLAIEESTLINPRP
ncbi:MAG: hypothetical protein ACYTG0_15160 [Planctomycetota bacterium]|jgi:uncharacterized repeat protein (TIGR01451 family)